jgi:hypothetical protein
MPLLLIALFGLLVPNGLFVYWLFYEFESVEAVLSNTLAIGFMLDALLATALLAWLFALRPVGRLRWPWFVVFALVGGLGFAIPFYLWMNRRRSAEPAPSFADWWRAA